MSVPRILQSDAGAVDTAFESYLARVLQQASSLLAPRWSASYEEEIQALLRLLFRVLSAMRFGTTYGRHLLGLTFADAWSKSPGARPSRLRLLLHAMAGVALPWLYGQILTLMLDHGWHQGPRNSAKRRFYRIILALEKATAVLKAVHALAFLSVGKYTDLIDMALGLSTEAVSPLPLIDSSVLMRELLWQAESACLNTITTVVDLPRAVRRAWEWFSGFGDEPEQAVALPVGCCASCGARPAVMPCGLPCGHVLCFYCTVTPVAEQGTQCQCPHCQQPYKATDIGWIMAGPLAAKRVRGSPRRPVQRTTSAGF